MINGNSEKEKIKYGEYISSFRKMYTQALNNNTIHEVTMHTVNGFREKMVSNF